MLNSDSEINKYKWSIGLLRFLLNFPDKKVLDSMEFPIPCGRCFGVRVMYRTNDKVRHLSRPCVTRRFHMFVMKNAKRTRSRSPFRKIPPLVSRFPIFFSVILMRSLDTSS